MAAARIDKVGFDTLHLAQVRIGEDLMRAFLIGIAVAAIGWETGGLAAEPPLAARSVQLISMGATSPQRPLRAGEDVEEEAPQAADHARSEERSVSKECVSTC